MPKKQDLSKDKQKEENTIMGWQKVGGFGVTNPKPVNNFDNLNVLNTDNSLITVDNQAE